MTSDLDKRIGELSESQVAWIEQVVAQFGKPKNFRREAASDIITPAALNAFGDTLQIHHCFSKEAFTKDKFEYALERVLKQAGKQAELAPRGNPGHDITISGQRVSLKTQADKNIKRDQLWISKFMELGRGDWSDQDADLLGLRESFFRHMDSYDRIFSLRRLVAKAGTWEYELVEIPKALLLEAADGRLEMMHNSRQNPKPGYCYVTGANGENKFQLYFDGGSERKLQIKALEKENCLVHAVWQFTTN